ncbi:GntR family transcriptional regulator [Marinomonas sp. C2222]|uniref:GntR family transcriptional regulator n=1 Tax=Marinomonas sargassi TaxID=2984494 RepID=A0ABT2YW02_9GAMM|nr:GntR family transcriptional regulator [Marinomonas sargassi]MCV2403754.1 GntR family transcriptional regulator [Marinomonas sargassi]
MSRKNSLFQKLVNQLLEDIDKKYQVGDILPSDVALAELFGVSRTTVRKAIEYLEEQEVVLKSDSGKVLLSMPKKEHFFDVSKLSKPKEKIVEEYFLGLIQSGALKSGDKFSELELARQSESSTVVVREFLIRFSRFGLIEKNPRSQWQMKKFDENFIDQLHELRYLFEMNSLSHFMSLPDSSDYWGQLNELFIDHKNLMPRMHDDYESFPKLDERFHFLLQEARPNPFISEFYTVISFIYHYHYQWERNKERERNTVAVKEHIDIMACMLMKDYQGATIALAKHLDTAKNMLKNTALL